jgi:hypothetical protein
MENFPNSLKDEAAKAGLSVKEYLLRERPLEDLPTLRELTKKIRRRRLVSCGVANAG